MNQPDSTRSTVGDSTGDGGVVLLAGGCWTDGGGRSDRTEILVRDGRIERVGTVPKAAAPGARVVDLSDRTLLPGFIDCHVHTTVDPSALLAGGTKLSPTQLALATLPVLTTILDHGFTTVRDLATFALDPVTLHLRDAVASGTVTGPRMIVAPHLISARGGHGDLSASVIASVRAREIVAVADGPAEIASRVRQEIRAGADWVKFGATGGFGSPSDDPTQTTYSQEEMNVLVATARDLGVPCTPHAYGDEGVQRAVHAGVRSIEHGNLASAQTLRLMSERGIYLVPTQYMVADALANLDDNSYWEGKAQQERDKFRRYEDRLRESAQNVADSNVSIAFGTDIGMFPHSEAWREFPTMVANGISAERALRAATSVAADLLQRQDLGRLEPGAVADVIAVDGDPLADIEATGRVAFVMRGGRLHRSPE
ncbi:Xaa-Pro dipeptidase [Streptomyces fumigatiscleroticus]|nr:Xaa-Pro dipeptidase [Streptomyces fumigatiscleroticus]